MDPITIPPTIEGIEQALDTILSEKTPAKSTVLSVLKKERILRLYKRTVKSHNSSEAMSIVAEETGESVFTVNYVVRNWQYRASKN